MQLLNAPCPRDTASPDSAILIDVAFLQLWNAYLPMLVTLAGIYISPEKALHPSKASVPIDDTFDGIVQFFYRISEEVPKAFK